MHTAICWSFVSAVFAAALASGCAADNQATLAPDADGASDGSITTSDSGGPSASMGATTSDGSDAACESDHCGVTCGSLTTCTPDGGAPYCANTATDSANCGTCGTACASGTV